MSGVPNPYYVSVAYSHEPTDPRIRRHCEAMARRGWRVVHIGLAGPGERSVGRLRSTTSPGEATASRAVKIAAMPLENTVQASAPSSTPQSAGSGSGNQAQQLLNYLLSP